MARAFRFNAWLYLHGDFGVVKFLAPATCNGNAIDVAPVIVAATERANLHAVEVAVPTGTGDDVALYGLEPIGKPLGKRTERNLGPWRIQAPEGFAIPPDAVPVPKRRAAAFEYAYFQFTRGR